MFDDIGYTLSTPSPTVKSAVSVQDSFTERGMLGGDMIDPFAQQSLRDRAQTQMPVNGRPYMPVQGGGPIPTNSNSTPPYSHPTWIPPKTYPYSNNQISSIEEHPTTSVPLPQQNNPHPAVQELRQIVHILSRQVHTLSSHRVQSEHKVQVLHERLAMTELEITRLRNELNSDREKMEITRLRSEVFSDQGKKEAGSANDGGRKGASKELKQVQRDVQVCQRRVDMLEERAKLQDTQVRFLSIFCYICIYVLIMQRAVECTHITS
jgi:hypothetical protein